MAPQQYDIIVIGSGPGGYIAAIRAAQLGMKVAIVERDQLGGICLNWGCIPTKALLRSAEIYHLAKNSHEFGIVCSDVKIDFAKIIKRSRDIASKLSGGIASLLKKNKVTVINGHAKLIGNGKVAIESNGKSEEVIGKNIILATGARPKALPNLPIDGKFILSYKEAMIPNELPKSLLIVGSGAIGIEFASFYNTLGVDVTIVEIQSKILNQEDDEIAALAHKMFVSKGIKILTETEVIESKVNKNTVLTKLKGKNGQITEQVFDKVISAVGIVPNIEDLGLEKLNIKFDKGFIKTNDYLLTDEPNVYAIGDVVKGPWLAHKASHEGVICVEKIAGLKNVHALKVENIPACTYSMPQIASIGLTESKAKEKKLDIKVGKFPLLANGKAIAYGETEGFVKTIFDAKTGELLGAHMIGPEVTEMIQGFAIGKTLETTEIELMQTIFPHPTISESMHEAVLDAYKRALNF